MFSFNFKKNKGFTLVEMMVAIAVFSVVMVAAMSALLNVIDANNKARALKTAINNVSFALESISRDMRMGTDYKCGTDPDVIPVDVAADCGDTSTDGGVIIGYISPRAFPGQYVYYKFADEKIWECLEKNGGDLCDDSADFTQITSDEVIINSLEFYVFGVDNPTKQPKMMMTLSGEAGGSKDKIKTTFDLQTTVSQRIRPGLF